MLVVPEDPLRGPQGGRTPRLKNPDLEDYVLDHKDSETNTEGVMIYIKEALRCNLKKNIIAQNNLHLSPIEEYWIEVETNTEPIMIGSDLSTSYQSLQQKQLHARCF